MREKRDAALPDSTSLQQLADAGQKKTLRARSCFALWVAALFFTLPTLDDFDVTSRRLKKELCPKAGPTAKYQRLLVDFASPLISSSSSLQWKAFLLRAPSCAEFASFSSKQ
eukprot:CAMPEP_0178459468 /NCGR_PEP_ID=MMETSP0689_2-20121128/48147_1 /TAXON_ID=160604 /ORGANISM="Amphidinium massartii, Strain CS-259" /LENGTH=111 /DNA_ID=CAMNT_0020085949 /DNA_START=173 /DNA_END=509 /DNA_ORIENTATION=+